MHYFRAINTTASFNPRPCARGDIEIKAETIVDKVFQSTPLCEGRLQVQIEALKRHLVSIHAPVRGATL